MAATAHTTATPRFQPALALAALGVIYGDIGTSPLYAAKEVFKPSHGIPLTPDTILGGISAIFWSLMVIVSIKYVILIMRADNKGEGGIMALLALALASVKDRPQWLGVIAVLGIYGAALFYGDSVITPAISVLSAIEGLEVATPLLKPYVIPSTLVVLIALFMIQKGGTSKVGALFGPVMIVWFAALAVGGAVNIVNAPQILAALNPEHAIFFLTDHGFSSFLVLGSVFLAVTGAEALYADMGHFGKATVRYTWFFCAFPALALNYFGQGALLLTKPEAASNPFYFMFPSWALLPMVGLATAATVIASQAVISGTYSITKQAIQLGYLPRTNVIHTSEHEIGQIYIPFMNWVLLAAVMAAVLGFGSSSNLASAYGLAVSGTMMITTFLTFFVVRYTWHHSFFLSVFATALLLIVDASFFAANLIKFVEGGWFPLVMGTLVFTIMVTWRHGRDMLLSHLRTSGIQLDSFLPALFQEPPARVPGTAVFLIGDPSAVPHALLHNLAHNKVLHERIVFLTVIVHDTPWLPVEERVSTECLGNNCFRLLLNFGFKEDPDVPKALEHLEVEDVGFNLMETSFFVSREKVIPVSGKGMALWRERLFATMARNAGSIVDYLNIPTNRVVELGTQVEI